MSLCEHVLGVGGEIYLYGCERFQLLDAEVSSWCTEASAKTPWSERDVVSFNVDQGEKQARSLLDGDGAIRLAQDVTVWIDGSCERTAQEDEVGIGLPAQCFG